MAAATSCSVGRWVVLAYCGVQRINFRLHFCLRLVFLERPVRDVGANGGGALCTIWSCWISGTMDALGLLSDGTVDTPLHMAVSRSA